MSLYIPQDRKLTAREQKLYDSLPQDRDLTPAERRRYNGLVNPNMTIFQKIGDRFNPDPPCRIPGMFNYGNMNRAYRFHARLDMAVAVVALVIGLFLSHVFVEFMYTRSPEEAQFLGQSCNIVAAETKMKIKLIIGGFLAFLAWGAANMDRR